MTTGTRLHRVHLRAIPVSVWHETRLWFEGLMREFDIIAAESQASTPRELLDFVVAASEKFERFSNDPNAILEEAWQQGRPNLDLDLELPPEAAQAARDMWSHIVAADEFCRDGNLLTMAIKDEPRRFVEWYLGEVADQIEGAQPRPWTG
ncbi:MAG TPA: hypothetical protein VHL52_15375 [Acidimicrobiia bacterium]|nr:hypothetical protein [Acidimicrobiia bacterium]